MLIFRGLGYGQTHPRGLEEHMAKDLNKTRMRDTRILVLLVLTVAFFTAPVITEESLLHDTMMLTGYILLIACAVGRIYTSAFIGGVKNEKLMTDGPYSMCRNPLYFYSLLGALGFALMSVQVTQMVLFLLAFYYTYHQLIRREEEFLAEKFGAEYEAYRSSTPRLMPNIKKFRVPDEITIKTKYLTHAVWDAIWWFTPLPLFELAELLQTRGIITPLIQIP